MGLLRPGQGLKPFGNLLEPLLPGPLGKFGIHLGKLVGFPLDGGMEIFFRVPHGDPGGGIPHLGQEIEMSEGVPGFPFGGIPEDSGDVRLTLDVGLSREIKIPAVRLGLPGEGRLEILERLGSL